MVWVASAVAAVAVLSAGAVARLEELLSDDVIVVFGSGQSNSRLADTKLADRDAFLQSFGSERQKQNPRSRDTAKGLYEFGEFVGAVVPAESLEVVRKMEAFPGVKSVSSNEMIYVSEDAQGSCSSSQSTGSGLYNLDHVDNARTYDQMYHHNASGGSGVRVYVLDTGVETEHPEFNTPAKRWDTGACFEECIHTPAWKDMDEHGTHVAGTVLGNTYGVAKSATLVPVRVLGDSGLGPVSGFISGIQWAYNDMSSRPGKRGVINMSLGSSVSSAMNDAVEAAYAAGLVVVVSAGNEGVDACQKSPASAPNAITVGAIDNFGYCTLSGTSQATPLVAGIAAVVLGLFPDASSAAVWSLLDQVSSKTLTDPGTDATNRPVAQLPCSTLSNPTNPPPPPSSSTSL